MTKLELNRDIKRLSKQINRMTFEQNDDFYSFIAKEAKEEFTRLHYAADNYETLSTDNIIRMIKMNTSYRFIPFHQFHAKMTII